MKIAFVEIGNFRKLHAVHVALSDTTSLFVGANNSGKTSAMDALRTFLKGGQEICLNDFSLSHWQAINDIGAKWLASVDVEGATAPELSDWLKLLPFLDLWLHVEPDEIHYVSKLIPTLGWSGGLLGVRLRFEPKDITALFKDFIDAIRNVAKTKKHAKEAYEASLAKGATADETEEGFKAALWPNDMVEFLSQRLSKHFGIKGYPLDPTKRVPPTKGIASPQELSPELDALDASPFDGLIRIDDIDAQRGLGRGRTGSDENDQRARQGSRKLTDQLKGYYSKHLDPSNKTEPADLVALFAIERAQQEFDKRLTASFSPSLREVEGLGYPGGTDPRIRLSTRINPSDGLNHGAAVQYEITDANGGATKLRLPEDYNGLGYQNLISMVFRLMAYRDAWMRVGKAANTTGGETDASAKPPLHLVLVEEPEAHLHAQVQQVFIRKAYKVLRDHPDLGAKKTYTTQLVVSSHSSHLAHEADFSSLRYFRRLPAGFKLGGGTTCAVPISTVINMSEVFDEKSDTARFARRFLRTTHCDLFFADAVILVEGPAEKMLVPHFIHRDFPYLQQCYITMLEIGGSHAHRLKPLIDHIGLTTLIVTDLDAGDPAKSNAAVQPARNASQKTNNSTLQQWLPKASAIDDLLDKPAADKILEIDELFSVRVAYQRPVACEVGGKSVETLSNTFEDALVFENLPLFAAMSGTGLIAKFRESIAAHGTDAAALGSALFDALRKTKKKAEFALDLLDLEDPKALKAPTYVSEGLKWLEETLRKRQAETLAPVVKLAEAVGVAANDTTTAVPEAKQEPKSGTTK